MKKIKSSTIVTQALIAAIYTAIGIILAPFSFGTVQVRVSEALTLLPIFGFSNVWGVTLGCLITNIIGLATGANILGRFDILFGTLATFTAAILTYLFRNVRFKELPVLSAIPPIVINAVVVGWELCLMLNNGSFNGVIFWTQAASVALGQFISCAIIGVFVVRIIEKNTHLNTLMNK